jgi:hypothetical protein
MTRGISRCGITKSPRPSVPLQFEAYGRRTFRMRSVMLRSLRMMLLVARINSLRRTRKAGFGLRAE